MAVYPKNGHVVYDQVSCDLGDKISIQSVTRSDHCLVARTDREARGIAILQGSVGKEHIQLLVSCPPSLAPTKVMQYLKGHSSKLLQDECPFRVEETVLGAALMVQRIFLCNG